MPANAMRQFSAYRCCYAAKRALSLLRLALHLPQLADSTAAVNINGDISDNRHSRPTVFVSF
jgi:hypothetical protein